MRVVAAEFPGVASVIRSHKRDDYAELARQMQKRESDLIIGSVCGRLMREHPEVPVLTIHDSLMTTPEHSDLIAGMVREAMEGAGIHPTLTVEGQRPTRQPYHYDGKREVLAICKLLSGIVLHAKLDGAATPPYPGGLTGGWTVLDAEQCLPFVPPRYTRIGRDGSMPDGKPYRWQVSPERLRFNLGDGWFDACYHINDGDRTVTLAGTLPAHKMAEAAAAAIRELDGLPVPEPRIMVTPGAYRKGLPDGYVMLNGFLCRLAKTVAS